MSREIQKIVSGPLDVRKELPTGDPIRLDFLDGWENLDDRQKLYLISWFEYFPRKTAAAMNAQIQLSEVGKWMTTPSFKSVFDMIQTLHAEALAARQYEESYVNSKIRAHTLRSLKADGYESKDKVTQRIDKAVIVGDMSNFLNQLNDASLSRTDGK